MKYKMVVMDIDGTLVDNHGNIAIEDKNAIDHLLFSNVIVSLCTNRTISATLPIIKELGLKTFDIFFDGALVYNPREMTTLYSRPLDTEILRAVIKFSRENNIHLELYSRDKFLSEKAHWSDEVHRNLFHIEPTTVNFDDISGHERILKASIVAHNNEEAAKVKLFEDHFGNKLHYSTARSTAFPEVDFVNIVDPQVSVGAALGKMMDNYGYIPAEVIAIGEGVNHIPLLQAAGVSVAMGNAFPEVKQASNYVTLNNAEHGVAAAINFFFPT